MKILLIGTTNTSWYGRRWMVGGSCKIFLIASGKCRGTYHGQLHALSLDLYLFFSLVDGVEPKRNPHSPCYLSYLYCYLSRPVTLVRRTGCFVWVIWANAGGTTIEQVYSAMSFPFRFLL
jgi:hypothetical protein